MARRRERSPRRPRISRRTSAFIALCAAVVALFSVLVSLQSVLYGTPLPLSFILGAALCVSPLLSISHPRWAIGLFTAGALALRSRSCRNWRSAPRGPGPSPRC